MHAVQGRAAAVAGGAVHAAWCVTTATQLAAPILAFQHIAHQRSGLNFDAPHQGGAGRAMRICHHHFRPRAQLRQVAGAAAGQLQVRVHLHEVSNMGKECREPAVMCVCGQHGWYGQCSCSTLP